MIPEIVPVILCGGVGARLWPLSTRARPKQFLPLIDGRSTFQETLERVRGTPGVSTVLVVAHRRHRALVEAQAGEGVVQLLEPVSRDSAPAIAAAAAWIVENRPGAVAAFVSADHHIPDRAAFAEALSVAGLAALDGRIVTLGLRPDTPSTGFGYIRPLPDGGAVAPVGAFVEKPDAEAAARYIAAGYLWNSGNFISRPEVILAELDAHAPAVAKAARLAVETAAEEAGVLLLGSALGEVPRISIDHALMERTTRAAVLPVGFAWSDIGAWAAVLVGARRDERGNSLEGDVLAVDCEGCLARTPSGLRVAMIGLTDVAVVVGDGGDLLVCDLGSSQAVKAAWDRFADPDGSEA